MTSRSPHIFVCALVLLLQPMAVAQPCCCSAADLDLGIGGEPCEVAPCCCSSTTLSCCSVPPSCCDSSAGPSSTGDEIQPSAYGAGGCEHCEDVCACEIRAFPVIPYAESTVVEQQSPTECWDNAVETIVSAHDCHRVVMVGRPPDAQHTRLAMLCVWRK